MPEAVVVDWSLVSCFGHDVKAACAAARAGISRSGALPELEAADPFSEPAPVIGHQVPLCAEGLEGDTRLCQILATTLRSIDGALSARRLAWPQLPLFLALPEDPSPPDDETDRFDAGAVLGRACQWANIPVPRLIQGCRANVGAWHIALRAALQLLQAGKEQYCVVCVVDSYFDGFSVAAAQEAGRLKTPQNAAGLVPGEAGVALLLQRAGSREGTATISEITVAGALTAPVVREVMRARNGDSRQPWFLVDQTGSYEAALRWGTLLTALGPGCNPIVWHPAIHFGDVRNAFESVGVCMVLEAQKRNYAAGPTAYIVSSPDPQSAAVTIVQATR